jgi:NTP pyrophosphatase (non-canonical NTP hydrolase)
MSRVAARWHPPHGLDAWTPERWYTAMMGEAGELGNAMKKHFRVLDGIANINHEPGRQLDDDQKVMAKIEQEIGDTFLYLLLLSARYRIDPERAIVKVFNAKSEEYNFPERL